MWHTRLNNRWLELRKIIVKVPLVQGRTQPAHESLPFNEGQRPDHIRLMNSRNVNQKITNHEQKGVYKVGEKPNYSVKKAKGINSTDYDVIPTYIAGSPCAHQRTNQCEVKYREI